MGRRRRPRPGRDRAAWQAANIGREIRLARVTLALSRRELDRRAGVALSTVSRIERGDPGVQLDTLIAVGAAIGLDVVVKAYPGATPELRDTGQLRIAELLCGEAHAGWRPHLELPAGEHGRAADLVFMRPDEILHIEIERSATDYQAQYRAAAAKREWLAARHARPVRLVLVVEDTRRNRAAVRAHQEVIRKALPAGSRDVLAALRKGEPLGRDGLLWTRRPSPARARSAPPLVPDRSIG